MNKFITAIKSLDKSAVEKLFEKDASWLQWAETDGKNALHYVCGVVTIDEPEKEAAALDILKLLLQKGMDVNAVHNIGEDCGFFPATPLWYAYTRGRNKSVYSWLLAEGANPGNCMFAIAWYNDAEAAELFKKYGAGINDVAGGYTPFLSAFTWRKFEAAHWFLKNGADVNGTDDDGNTALYYAVKRKMKPEQIQMLLQFGADADQENSKGVSPKKLAEQNRQRKILKMFENN